MNRMRCIIVSAFFLVNLLQSGLTDHAVKYLGFPLKERELSVSTEGKIVLFKNIVFSKGRVTHFHAMFGADSHFHFQIWRPKTNTKYCLISDTAVISTPTNFTLNVTADNIQTLDGDRLGFCSNHSDKAPLQASMANIFTTVTLFNENFMSNPIEIGDEVTFNQLAYPYIFSIGATYIPDKHDDGIYVGATGPRGYTGQMGPMGEKGEVGPPGLAGEPGNPGPVGATGLRGSAGATGATGPSGSHGSTGSTGRVGLKGDIGPMGKPGAKGEQGATGATGPLGSTGATGSTGYTGIRGNPGPKGDIGPDGDIGATGATGASGPVGLPGATGNPGPLGPQGHTGPRGNPGSPGQPGLPGIVVGIQGTCSDRNLTCSHNCAIKHGMPQCSCKPGYKLNEDGQTCQDINECKQSNGGCQMVCVNLQGSYTCQCKDGLKLSSNGHTCVDILECATNNGNCLADQLCLELYSSNSSLCVVRDDAVYITMAHSTQEKRKDLVNHNIVMGLIIWLALLTLLVFLVITVYCVQKRKFKKDRNFYQRYAQFARPSYPPY